MLFHGHSHAGRAAFAPGAAWMRLLLVAALVAAALRAITPIGYMIGHDEATGRIAITICTGMGETPAFLDPETGEVTEDDGAPDDPGLPVAFAQSPLWRAQSVFHDSQSAVSPPPSRGPPLHA